MIFFFAELHHAETLIIITVGQSFGATQNPVGYLCKSMRPILKWVKHHIPNIVTVAETVGSNLPHTSHTTFRSLTSMNHNEKQNRSRCIIGDCYLLLSLTEPETICHFIQIPQQRVPRGSQMFPSNSMRGKTQ